VAFFPSDHYYSDEGIFRTAADRPDSLVLVGAAASYPETEHGWIAPGPAPVGHLAGSYPVSRFWEKPSLETAQGQQLRGYLWNTFVTVGRVSAFFCLLQSSVPGLLPALSAAERNGNAAQAYMLDLQPVDFSQQVLSRCTTQLLVIRLAASVGWSDLGKPDAFSPRWSMWVSQPVRRRCATGFTQEGQKRIRSQWLPLD
jgi:mannose-1-phosphate guanylyltransferase